MGNRRDIGDGRTALEDGTVVGGYTVSYLASGGMSIVYKGEREGQTYVLKEVATSNTREVPSLISEKGLLERLSHPSVVTFYSFFNENGCYYLVLEYVPGQPLSSYFPEAKRPSPERVAEWGVQLCEVFDYLHAQKPPVIYRDLKAENILLYDDQIRLIDFGIARLHKGVRAKDTELMGSPATASPEHYGGAETDARSDIYTIGATLYELMTGGKRKQLGAFQFAPVRELNTKVSPELEAILAKATAFKPEERYQSALDMRDALLKALGREVPGRPKSDISSAEPASGGKSPWMLVSIVLVVLLLGVGWFGYQRYEEKKNSPFYNGPVPSIGTYEASLNADIFTAGKVEGKSAVMLGEDIGLFLVSASGDKDADTRSKTVAKRLNSMYHTACVSCGGTGLEPGDIKIGRHVESGETVIFYAHMHGEELHWGPELLATVGNEQAEQLQVTPRFVASYWRDLIRDTVNLSRGFEVHDSALGHELSTALLKARQKLEIKAEQLPNLRNIISEVTGRDSLRMKDLFLAVPDKKPSADNFPPIPGYEPLNL